MRLQLWDNNDIAAHTAIAEGMLPLEPLVREAFERNVGKVRGQPLP